MGVFHNNDIPLPKCTEIQPAFSRVLERVVRKLTLCFPDLIHSIYVYDSVAEGRAEAGKSDLDMTIIFRHKLDQTTTEQLAAIQAELEKIIPLSVKLILIVVCWNRFSTRITYSAGDTGLNIIVAAFMERT